MSASKHGFWVLLVIAAAFLIVNAHAQEKRVRIGVIMDGPWQRNDAIVELFQSEIRALLAGEFQAEFPPEHQIVANWSLEGVIDGLNRLLRAPDVDIVLGMGVIASNEISRWGPLPKPVIAPFVLDAAVQGLPMRDGTSGVKNLAYVSLPSTVGRDIRAFRELVPFTRMAILLNKIYIDSNPNLLANIQRQVAEFDIEPVLIPVGHSADEVFAALPADIEAVYVAPLIHLPAGELDRIVQGLIERQLPSFTLMGGREVERGFMASVNPDIFPRLSRRVALIVQRILLGQEPGNIPVGFAAGEKLVLNMSTVRALGVWIPFAAMTEAELIAPLRQETPRELNLNRAIEEALEANLELLAKKHEVAASAQNIALTRSALLPQLNLGATALQIDKDRADASFGSAAQRQLSGTVTLQQQLYSNSAWTNYNAQRHFQRATEREHEQLRLDIVQEAAAAYLNVLRAKASERIERENLQRTRQNLELAQVREAVGYSGQADVYRWESEIAADRSQVIVANSQRNLAEIQLNRIRHRPLEEHFSTAEIDLQDDLMMREYAEFLRYFENQGAFRALREFVSNEGIARSQEVRQLDALIAGQEAVLAGSRRAFWAPNLGLQAQLENIFTRTKTEGGVELPGNGLIVPVADDLNWTVALNLSFPLFAGGFKKADQKQAEESLSQLRVQRQEVAQRIEQRIRSALHVAGASHANIKLSRDALTAAAKNLELVVDAYSQGVTSLIELIDAQNAALVAEQAAANAVYTFLIDLFEAQRAAGFYLNLMPANERVDLLQRLQAFEQERQANP